MANVIITGCSRGIGFQLAKLFAEKKHQVLALSRNEKPILSLGLDSINAFSFDLQKDEDLVKLVSFLDSSWKKADILINNAGSLLNKPFLDTSREDFRSLYEVNVFGVAAVIRMVLPYMSGSGHVVNISSQ